MEALPLVGVEMEEGEFPIVLAGSFPAEVVVSREENFEFRKSVSRIFASVLHEVDREDAEEV